MRRCVIIGGAAIENYALLRNAIKKDDYFIFCDSGLMHAPALGVAPDLIVGDFDSCQPPVTRCEIIFLPREKDDTDTFFGVKEGLRRGYTDFLLLGVIGGRLDHTLSNISILPYLEAQGARGVIWDNHSQMELVKKEGSTVGDDFAYFSLLSLGEEARGITVKNAKFPLRDAVITNRYSYGVSNEVLPGQQAEITFSEGTLLLIRVFSA